MFNRSTLVFLTVTFTILFAVSEKASGYMIRYPDVGDDYGCLMINSTNLRFFFTYQSKTSTTTQYVGIPGSDGSKGNCKGNGRSVTLSQYGEDSVLDSVQFQFNFPNKSEPVKMQITLNYYPSRLANSSEHTDDYWTARSALVPLNGVNYSYYCNKSQVIPLTNSVTIIVDELQIQAFHLVNNSFSSSNGSVCPIPMPPTTTSTTSSTSPKPSSSSSPSTTRSTTGSSSPSTSSVTISTTQVTPTTSSTESSSTMKTTTTTATTSTSATNTTTGTATTSTSATSTTTGTATTSTSATSTAHHTTTTNSPTTSTTDANVTTSWMNISTTSTHEPTTTHMITAAPTPINQTFAVKDGDNNTCLLFKAAMELTFAYERNGTNMTYTAIVPKDAKVANGSSCGEEMETLIIDWSDKSIDASIELEFTKSDGNFTMSAVGVTFALMMASEPRIVIGNTSASGLKMFSTSLDNYFLCSSGTNITLEDGSSLNMTSIQIQSFRKGDKADFYGSENNCRNPGKSGTSTDTVVPIVVGVVLASLVVIVLIGYCIGRRRANKAEEYDRL